MSGAFWVLERDGRYVAIFSEQTGAGGFSSTPRWVDDIKDARHWECYSHADDIRRGLPHPYWAADPVEHAFISPDEYADGLAAEIAKWKARVLSLQQENERLLGVIRQGTVMLDGCVPFHSAINRVLEVFRAALEPKP